MKHSIFKIEKPETDYEKRLHKEYKYRRISQVVMGLMLLLTNSANLMLGQETMDYFSENNNLAGVIGLLFMACNGLITYAELDSMLKDGQKASSLLHRYQLAIMDKNSEKESNTNPQPEA